MLRTTADAVFQFCRVVGSSLVEAVQGSKRPVQYQVEGVPGLDLAADEDEATVDGGGGEVDDGDVYGQIGIVCRPLPPDDDTDGDHAEAVCVRFGDSLIPIASRDVRARMFGDAPNEGTVALVGYGGGYHAISPVDNDDTTKGAIQVIYCPYDFNASGVAQKAHAITLDPTTPSPTHPSAISIIHATAGAFMMLDDGIQPPSMRMQSPDGQSFVQVEDGKVTIQAAQVVLLGGIVSVGNPTGAVPLTPGPSSPPCPRLWLNAAG